MMAALNGLDVSALKYIKKVCDMLIARTAIIIAIFNLDFKKDKK